MGHSEWLAAYCAYHPASAALTRAYVCLLYMHWVVMQQPSVPLAETVAALVAEASAQHSAQQQEQLHQLETNYQAALQQREQQHVSLLRELADLRQLQEESSMISNSSAATEVAAAIPAMAAAVPAAPAIPAAPAAAAVVQASGNAAGTSHADGLPGGQQKNAGMAQQHDLQQQQQQGERESKDEDAMSALIAAVLGPGPIGRAQQQLHQQRLLEQHKQQEEEEEQKRQQQARAQQQRAEQQELADMQAQLDKLLGLGSTHSQAAAALRNQQQSGVRPLTGTDYSSTDLAPANADLAAALARAKVAETCLPALQDISCSSAYNASSPRGGNACSSSGSAFSSKPPWRPASPTKCSPQKQQQQQWQQWQQHPSAGSTKARSRSLSPVRQQQGQGPRLPLLQCVRCGQQQGPDLGPCCFHPGLVAAPGPLMFGQEWHACRWGKALLCLWFLCLLHVFAAFLTSCLKHTVGSVHTSS